MVKQFVGRGRPSAHIEGVTVHGSAQSGLGFPWPLALLLALIASMIVALLVQHDVEVEEVRRARATLEDAFLDLMGSEAPSGGTPRGGDS